MFQPSPEDFGGNQTLTPSAVQELLREIRSTAGGGNPPVRGIDTHNMMLARSGGYPKFLYHDTMEPVQVLNAKEEAGLIAKGFRPNYEKQVWPHAGYRRNMDPRFAGLLNDGSSDPAATPYVESRVFKSEVAYKGACAQKTKPGLGQWKLSLHDIEPLPEEITEDPALSISRLEGQLEEARRKQKTA